MTRAQREAQIMMMANLGWITPDEAMRHIREWWRYDSQ
jgi:hypothetical protein